MINQVSGSLNHPPGATREVKPSAFTGKRYEMLVATAVAFDPQKTMFQPATGEIVVELLSDETRKPGALFSYMVQELRQVLFDDGKERRLLGFVAPVANQVGSSIQTGLSIDYKHNEK